MTLVENCLNKLDFLGRIEVGNIYLLRRNK
jgi:hypothetical protein